VAGERTIKITIVGDAAPAQKTFSSAGQDLTTFDAKVEGLSGKMSGFGSVMTGVLAAGAIQSVGGFLKNAAQAAADDAASTERLKQAVENSGVSYDSYADTINTAISNGQQLAFSDDETRGALTLLTQETGSTEEALARLSAAQDLSRGTGMSLEQAAKLLGKASDENTGILKKYGITLDENATAQDVMNEVDARFGGQAAAFAQTGAGQWAILQDKLGEVEESIGAALIPALGAVVGVITTVVDAVSPWISKMQESTPVMVGLAAAIVTVLVPALVLMAASALAAVAPFLPLIAIALAVGAAVAALYLAWSTNFLGIQTITTAVIDFIVPYLQTAMDTILAIFNAVWPVVQTVVEFAMSAIATAIQTYLGIAQAVFDAVFPVIQAIVEAVMPIIASVVETYISGVATAVSTSLGVVQSVFETVWPIVQSAVETACTAIQTAVGLITTAFDTTSSAVGIAVGSMQTAVETAFGKIESVANSIMGPAGTVVSAVSDGVSGAYNAVVGLVDDMYNAGYDFIHSLLDGIESGIQALKDAIGGIGDILGSVDVPGFSPPGEAGYELGYAYADGLARGVEVGTQEKVKPAVAGLGATLTDPAATGGSAYDKWLAFAQQSGDYNNDWLGHMTEAEYKKAYSVAAAAGHPLMEGKTYQKYMGGGGTSGGGFNSGANLGKANGASSSASSTDALAGALARKLEEAVYRGIKRANGGFI
jgi:hypothetical protein